MNSAIKMTLSRMSWPRLVAVTVVAPAAALLLIVIVAAQGDPDLPPYFPATAAERACSIVAAVIVWPAAVAAKWWRDGDNVVLMWALFLLSGLFWALSIEFLFLAKHATRKA